MTHKGPERFTMLNTSSLTHAHPVEATRTCMLAVITNTRSPTDLVVPNAVVV